MARDIFDVIGYECRSCGFINPLRKKGESLLSARTCKKCGEQKGFYGVYD